MEVVATHVRRQAILARSPFSFLHIRASSHGHETTCRSPDTVLTACLPFATPAAARWLPGLAARARSRVDVETNLGSSRHTTSAPIRTMQNRFVDRSAMLLLCMPVARRPSPSTCLPTRSSLSLPSPSLDAMPLA
jgi:hypothetical protein